MSDAKSTSWRPVGEEWEVWTWKATSKSPCHLGHVTQWTLQKKRKKEWEKMRKIRNKFQILLMYSVSKLATLQKPLTPQWQVAVCPQVGNLGTTPTPVQPMTMTLQGYPPMLHPKDSRNLLSPSQTMTEKLELSPGCSFCVGVGGCKVVVRQRCWRPRSLEVSDVSELEMSELEQSMEC